jgi:predicted AAA+ superfamily ATPase
MHRDKLNELIKWKNNPDRKPLIMKGARQVGKTWLLKEFGNTGGTYFIQIFHFRQEKLIL